MMGRLQRIMMVISMALMLSLPQISMAESSAVEEDPTALAMTADLLLVRPLMLGVTVLGSAIWLVGLPFSLAGGNAVDSGNTLVAQPAYLTFVRCLGCKKAGYQEDVQKVDGEENE